MHVGDWFTQYDTSTIRVISYIHIDSCMTRVAALTVHHLHGTSSGESHSMRHVALHRETEESVEELCQENGPYKVIEFKEKYAKRSSVQYIVSSQACFLQYDHCIWDIQGLSVCSMCVP